MGKIIMKKKQQLKKSIRGIKAALWNPGRWFRKVKSVHRKKPLLIKPVPAKPDITGKSRELRKTDIFLAATLAVLAVGLLITNLTAKKPYQPKWTEIRLSRQWETVFDSGTINTLITEFEKLNPQIRIKLTTPEAAQEQEMSAINLADNGSQQEAPDIVLMDDSRLSDFIRRQALLPLNTFTQNRDNAGQWAIPLVLSMDVLFYNIDILAAAGFDRPPKTREEFLIYARAVRAGSDAINAAATGLHADDPNAIRRDIFSWMWASGFPVVKDGEPWLDKRTLADLIAFLSQINQTGLPGESAFGKTGAQRLQEFAQGKLAMVIAPVQAISWLREPPVSFNFGITAVPGTPAQGNPMLGLSGLYAGISSSCVFSNEAWLFLSFIEENNAALAAKIKTVPGYIQGLLPAAAGFPGGYPDEDPLYAKAWDIFESSGIAETFTGYPLAGELEQIIREELLNHFTGRISPADAADVIQKRWEKLMAGEQQG
jgi:multiple sugar transport system substrate-binding protein